MEYIKGLYAKQKHARAPEYVVCKLSMKRKDLIEYLNGKQDEWINAEVKNGKNGFYVSIDDWKPTKKEDDGSVVMPPGLIDEMPEF